MKLTKKQLMIGGSSAAVCALIVGATSVSAASAGKPASLAGEIASAFHINQNDVQKVIDQHRDEVQNYREVNFQNRLDQAVKNGKITSSQETLIEQEQKQIQSDLTAIKDKTGTDRRTAMEQEWQKIRDWAKSNSIPLKYLAPFGGHHGMGMGFHMMNGSGGTPTSPSA